MDVEQKFFSVAAQYSPFIICALFFIADLLITVFIKDRQPRDAGNGTYYYLYLIMVTILASIIITILSEVLYSLCKNEHTLRAWIILVIFSLLLSSTTTATNTDEV